MKIDTSGILLIINPNAGLLNPFAGGAEELAHHARNILPGARIEITRTERQAEALVNDSIASGVHTVAAGGGDGTAHFLAGLLYGKNVSMGLIPLGSAGNVARSLGLPRSIRLSLRAILRGKTRVIDLGFVNGAHFIEAAGIGFHAELLKRYSRKETKSLSRSIYAFSRTMSEQSPLEARIDLDGRKIIRRAAQITVSNLPWYGTGFMVAPEAKLDDGMLDVALIGDMPPPAAPGIAMMARMGLLDRAVHVERFRARRIVIETDRPAAVHADAEVPCETPAEFTVRPGALRVIIP